MPICKSCGLDKPETAFEVKAVNKNNGRVHRRAVCNTCRSRAKRRRNRRDSLLVAWFDTETTSTDMGGIPYAYALGELADHRQDLSEITPETVERLVRFRLTRTEQGCVDMLMDLCCTCWAEKVNPIIGVHNLGFDLYALRSVLQMGKTSMIAKSTSKPITVTVDFGSNRKLTFWDSLGYSCCSLASMGQACGYHKEDGYRYDLTRHSSTPLTEEELEYIRHDVRVPWVWLANDARVKGLDISDYCNKVLTSTGYVRFDCKRSFPDAYAEMAKAAGYNNPREEKERRFVSNCMQGGWTVVSSKHVGKRFEGVLSIDATSQHPFQGCAHMYPYDFTAAPRYMLQEVAESIVSTTLDDVRERYARPFRYGCELLVTFENIRMRGAYAEHGIGLIPKGRIDHDYLVSFGEGSHLRYTTYYEEWTAVNPVYALNKLVSADAVTVYAHEIYLWCLSQVYEWDAMTVHDGYYTSHFRPPYDYFIDSTVKYYSGKNLFKRNKDGDFSRGTCESAPAYILDYCRKETRTAQEQNEVSAYYMSLKACLNGLYGVQATNPLRMVYELDPDSGELIESGEFEYNENARNDFRFGERIVGYAMMHQILAFEAIAPLSDAVILADTDSWKVKSRRPDDEVLEALEPLRKLDDDAIRAMCGDRADMLQGLGHYAHDGRYGEFAASHMKSYLTRTDGKLSIVCAGFSPNIPHSGPDDTLTKAVQREAEEHGFMHAFGICFGFNSIWTAEATTLKGRLRPNAPRIQADVTDYLGITEHVDAPAMLALFPMTKVMKDTRTASNWELAQDYIAAGADVPGGWVIDYAEGKFTFTKRERC